MIIKTTADIVLDIIEKEKLDNEKMKQFQSSLMLSNVPQTPKIVNASFLAFFMDQDITSGRVKELNSRDYLNSPLPLTARRSTKQKNYVSNDSSHNRLSFDQLIKVFDYKNNKLPCLSLTESDSNDTESEKLSDLFERRMNKSAPKKSLNQVKYIKQASLDSKIQYIYEEDLDLDLEKQNGNSIDSTFRNDEECK